jgi:hypothetical protein
LNWTSTGRFSGNSGFRFIRAIGRLFRALDRVKTVGKTPGFSKV